MAMDKAFFREVLRSYLLVQGICLTLLAATHIALAIASIFINAVNVYLRRSALPVILVILTLPVLVISLINAVYFDTLQPLVWAAITIPVSMLLTLVIRICAAFFHRKK